MAKDQTEITCKGCGGSKSVPQAAVPAAYICSECRAAWKSPTPSS